MVKSSASGVNRQRIAVQLTTRPQRSPHLSQVVWVQQRLPPPISLALRQEKRNISKCQPLVNVILMGAATTRRLWTPLMHASHLFSHGPRCRKEANLPSISSAEGTQWMLVSSTTPPKALNNLISPHYALASHRTDQPITGSHAHPSVSQQLTARATFDTRWTKKSST